MNYLKFAGVANAAVGVIVTKMPNLPVPAERGESIVIKGRDGSVWKSEGAYDMVSMVPTIFVKPERINDARAWLTGSGELEIGQNASSYYKARIAGGVEYTPLDFNMGYQASIPFECQPFRYVKNAPVYEVTASGTKIINPNRVYSEPVLTVYGSGDAVVTIGGTRFTLEGIVNGMIIDCEEKEAYLGTAPYNDRMTGAFPVLTAGENAVSWNGGITKIKVETRWRAL